MPRADHRMLVDRGRRSGLQTHELYQALSSTLAFDRAPYPGNVDGNGFVQQCNDRGRSTFQPNWIEGQRS